MVKNVNFFSSFPSVDFIIGVLIGDSFGISRNKASAIFCGTDKNDYIPHDGCLFFLIKRLSLSYRRGERFQPLIEKGCVIMHIQIIMHKRLIL